MRLAPLLVYATSCFLLNNVLQYHYFNACRASIFHVFTLGESGYCAFIDKSLQALQWSPLIVAAPLLLRARQDTQLE